MIHYLDKYNTFLRAKESGIKVAESYIVPFDGNETGDTSAFPIPCVLKPRESAHGEKKDIRVVMERDRLQETLNFFHDLGYREILLQEYIDYDFEFSIHGYATRNTIFVPGICKYLHKQKIGTNDYDYVQYISVEDFEAKNAVRQFEKFMKTLEFEGLFVGEAFFKAGEVYLNEINFRTCDLSYNETPSGHYIAPEYAAAATRLNPGMFHKKGKRTFYSALSAEILKKIIEKKLSPLMGIKEIISASSYMYFSYTDIGPWLQVTKNLIEKHVLRKEVDW